MQLLNMQSMWVCRHDHGSAPAISPFTDALYTAQLRLLLASNLPATAGAGHDLPSQLAELQQWTPMGTTAPSRQLRHSITFCAHLHSTLAWLAFQLSSEDTQQDVQHALLHADDAERHRQQLQGIFAHEAHQHLFMAYLQQYCPGDASARLDRPTCREGLGDWTGRWADAMRYVLLICAACLSRKFASFPYLDTCHSIQHRQSCKKACIWLWHKIF